MVVLNLLSNSVVIIRNVIDQSEWMERNGIYINRHAEATKQLEQLDKKKSEMLNQVRL